MAGLLGAVAPLLGAAAPLLGAVAPIAESVLPAVGPLLGGLTGGGGALEGALGGVSQLVEGGGGLGDLLGGVLGGGSGGGGLGDIFSNLLGGIFGGGKGGGGGGILDSILGLFGLGGGNKSGGGIGDLLGGLLGGGKGGNSTGPAPKSAPTAAGPQDKGSKAAPGDVPIDGTKTRPTPGPDLGPQVPETGLPEPKANPAIFSLDASDEIERRRGNGAARPAQWIQVSENGQPLRLYDTGVKTDANPDGLLNEAEVRAQNDYIYSGPGGRRQPDAAENYIPLE